MARKSDKRERLLDAAAESFWVDGYAATSLADIAERSQVPVGNIYYYFKTKAAIAILNPPNPAMIVAFLTFQKPLSSFKIMPSF